MKTCIVVLTFETVDKILWCDHSNEISLAVLFHSTICFAGLKKMKFGIFPEFLLRPQLGVKGSIKKKLFSTLSLSPPVHQVKCQGLKPYNGLAFHQGIFHATLCTETKIMIVGHVVASSHTYPN